MRLRRSELRKPGVARRRRGSGFAFYGPDGELLTDSNTLARIHDLVIPPAWKNVWICPHPNGHIQAVGTDAAGRRQYLYHQAWQDVRAEEKFDRVLELSKQLPAWRARIAADLAARGLTRDRILALALHLLDRGYFRAGGEQYAEEHESYGLATLLCEHVTVRRGSVVFDYPAKSGGAAQPRDRGFSGGARGAGVAAPRWAIRTTAGVPQWIRLGGRACRGPQYAVQGTCR